MQRLGIEFLLGSFTVGIFQSFFISVFSHSHDSHYFSLLFSFILINGGNEKLRMKEKVKKNNGNHEND